MPNYNLVCTECQHKWEAFMYISEREQAVCPKCSSNKVETDFSAKPKGAILIKGAGFYAEKTIR